MLAPGFKVSISSDDPAERRLPPSAYDRLLSLRESRDDLHAALLPISDQMRDARVELQKEQRRLQQISSGLQPNAGGSAHRLGRV